MANTYERLAALRPADTVEAELYASAADEYIVGVLYVCNQSAVDRTYRVAITDVAGVATSEDWLYYDFPLYANLTVRVRITMGNGETIRVQSGTADVISFVLSALRIS
jgi:hypothetical protein